MTQPQSFPQDSAIARSSRPTVAVVAVHGVGDHAPGDSARLVMELLLRLRHDGNALENRYTSFHERPVCVPVRPAHVSPRSAPEALASDTKGPAAALAWTERFREKSDYVALRHEGRGRFDRATDGLDFQFMRAQLAEYVSDGAPYETLRFEGQRLPPGGPTSPESDVHIYEMHWSNLGRLKWGVLQIGQEFYQLLFHLTNLGRQTIDHARIEHGQSRIWAAYSGIQTWTVRLFTLLVPLFWLTMASTVLTIIPVARRLQPVRTWLAWGVVALLLSLLVGQLAVNSTATPRKRTILLPPVVFVAAALLCWYLQTRLGGDLVATKVLTIEWLALTSLAVVRLAGKYERTRPGASFVATRLQGIAAGTLAIVLLTATSGDAMVSGTLRVFEVEIVVASIIWLTFFLCAALAGAFSVLAPAVTTRRGDEKRDRARQAAWTARATLAIACTGVFAVSFPLWALLYQAFHWALPSGVEHVTILPMFRASGTSAQAFIDEVFSFSISSGYPFLIIAMAFLGLTAMAAVIPSVIAEVLPPGPGRGFDLGSGAAATDASAERGRAAAMSRAERDARWASRLGDWYSAGFSSVRVLLTGLFVALILTGGVTLWSQVAAAIDPDAARGSWLRNIATSGKDVVILSGLWLSASAVGLAAFRGRFKTLLLGFRAVLDAALDVDTYLREHPRANTPRARIAERYASLLRYLCKWRDASGHGYAAIVFVSHSQGTVISADYLGFMRRELDPDLPVFGSSRQQQLEHDRPAEGRFDGPPLYLFTMGSPLRQLYNEAFPHLFSWVSGIEGNWRKKLDDVPRSAHQAPLAEPAGEHVRDRCVIAAGAHPDPLKIGLEQWVNAYRSGDYVGRNLWRPDGCPWRYQHYTPVGLYAAPSADDTATYWTSPTLLVSEDDSGTRRELCLGQGAHTHYWDHTARAVAIELDRLIASAGRRAASAMMAPAAHRQEDAASS